MKKFLQNSILAVFSLTLTLAVLEGGFRLLTSRAPVSSWSDRPRFYYRNEDAQSFQNLRFAMPKPDGVFRIGVVGDSISFGPWMQVDDVFPARLERMFNLNNVPLKTEVLNFGVPGYSTADEIQLTKQALEANVDLIILQITLNDPEKEPLRDANQRFGAYQPKGIWKSVFKYFKFGRFVAERLHNNFSHNEYKKYFFDLFENPETRDLFQNSAAQILQMAQAKNVKVVPVVFPLFGFPLEEGKYPFASLHEKISDFFKTKDLPVLDLYAQYKGLPLERLQVIPGGDLHPNEIAHRIAAETIYSYLIKRKLVPEELRIRATYPQRQHVQERRYKD